MLLPDRRSSARAGINRPDSEELSRIRIVADLDELCRRLGAGSAAENLDRKPRETWPPIVAPRPEDRLLLATLGSALARIATAQAPADQRDAGGESALRAALNGAHLATRTEILSGLLAEIRTLLPSFVYLTVMSVSDPAEAANAAAVAARLFA